MTKKSLVISSICVLGISMTSLAAAQSGDGNGASDKRAEFAAKMIERLDTNADGSISQEEFMAVVEERFTDTDADGDGAVTRGELRDASMMRRAERMIGRLDTDEDGKISLAEAQAAASERAERRFSRSDADDDGFITVEEVQERMGERGRHGKRAGKRHHRGGAINSMFRADRDRDGEITLVEVMSVREKRFDTLDANNDGAIDADEIVERSDRGHGKKGHGKRHR